MQIKLTLLLVIGLYNLFIKKKKKKLNKIDFKAFNWNNSNMTYRKFYLIFNETKDFQAI